MKEDFEIKISKARDKDFTYGNCALIAIANAFNTSPSAIHCLFLAIKCKHPEKGVSFRECQKVLYILSKSYYQYVNYFTNPNKITYRQFCSIFKKGKYLFNFDEHLSYMEDGIIYDSFIYINIVSKANLDKNLDYINLPPKGYWKIN